MTCLVMLLVAILKAHDSLEHDEERGGVQRANHIFSGLEEFTLEFAKWRFFRRYFCITKDLFWRHGSMFNQDVQRSM